jgi:hypothetical protein
VEVARAVEQQGEPALHQLPARAADDVGQGVEAEIFLDDVGEQAIGRNGGSAQMGGEGRVAGLVVGEAGARLQARAVHREPLVAEIEEFARHILSLLMVS